MIIGNGLLAKTFKEYGDCSNILIFASGVSNSSETNNNNFKREQELLINVIKNNQDKVIVYFSSCDVIYADKINALYYYHKIKMENTIKKYALKYHIFRLPQVIGFSSNKNSLINYFITSIVAKKEIKVCKNAYKNLINIQDILIIVKNILENGKNLNKTINIINKNYYSILEIILTIEEVLKCKAIIKLIDKGFKPEYTINYVEKSNIEFNDEYLKKSILSNYREVINE